MKYSNDADFDLAQTTGYHFARVGSDKRMVSWFVGIIIGE